MPTCSNLDASSRILSMKNSGLGPLLKSIVSGWLGDGSGKGSSQGDPSRNRSGQVGLGFGFGFGSSQVGIICPGQFEF